VSGQVGRDRLVWDPLVRALHWGMVASVTVDWLVSEGTVHDCAGYILLALVALRIVWGFVGPPHARFADFIRSHRSTFFTLG
jgi:cytochrome b